MSEPGDKAPLQSPALWTLVAFWFAWCLGPGVVFTLTPVISSGLHGAKGDPGWTTEDWLVLLAFVTSR
jgi:hypothetical protein